MPTSYTAGLDALGMARVRNNLSRFSLNHFDLKIQGVFMGIYLLCIAFCYRRSRFHVTTS